MPNDEYTCKNDTAYCASSPGYWGAEYDYYPDTPEPYVYYLGPADDGKRYHYGREPSAPMNESFWFCLECHLERVPDALLRQLERIETDRL